MVVAPSPTKQQTKRRWHNFWSRTEAWQRTAATTLAAPPKANNPRLQTTAHSQLSNIMVSRLPESFPGDQTGTRLGGNGTSGDFAEHHASAGSSFPDPGHHP